MVQEGAHQATPDPPASRRLRHADLVDPQLGGLVGVDVVDGRRHSHHPVTVQRHGEMVPGIFEELPHELGPQLVIEDIGLDVGQEERLAGPEHAYEGQGSLAVSVSDR